MDILFDHKDDLMNLLPKKENRFLTKPLLYSLVEERKFTVAEAIIKRCPEITDEVCHSKECRSRSIVFGLVKPIHMFAIDGFYEGLNLLLMHGANPNELSPGPEQRSIIQLLCSTTLPAYSRYDCVSLLLGSEVKNINQHDAAGKIPIDTAAELGDKPLVSKLLEHGADPSMVNTETNTSAMWYFVQNNDLNNKHSDILPLLYVNPSQERMMPSFRLTSGLITPQMMALFRQDIPSIRAFIEAGWFLPQSRYQDPRFESYLSRWKEENVKWLGENHLSKPASLQWWAKRTVRSCLPLQPMRFIDKLMIPTQLKEYVLRVDDLPPDKLEKLKTFKWWPQHQKSSTDGNFPANRIFPSEALHEDGNDSDSSSSVVAGADYVDPGSEDDEHSVDEQWGYPFEDDDDDEEDYW